MERGTVRLMLLLLLLASRSDVRELDVGIGTVPIRRAVITVASFVSRRCGGESRVDRSIDRGRGVWS